MTKTPEQMAEEYASWVDAGSHAYRGGVYEGFLVGYHAAMDQVADASKVINSSNNWNGWISVKDRLPEIPDNNYSNRVLLFRADGFIVIARIEKCVRFVRPLEQALIVETDNGDPIEEFTHWMPLPEPPKEEK